MNKCERCGKILANSDIIIDYKNHDILCKKCHAPINSSDLDKDRIKKIHTRDLLSNELELIDNIVKSNNKINPLKLQDLYSPYTIKEQDILVNSFLYALVQRYEVTRDDIKQNGDSRSLNQVKDNIRIIIKPFNVSIEDYNYCVENLDKKVRDKSKGYRLKKKIISIFAACVICITLMAMFVLNCDYIVVNGTIMKYQADQKDVVIPESYMGQKITKIGTGAFKDKDILSVKLSNNITEIGREAFADCDELETVEISSSVVRIYPKAFASCDKLKELVIPSSVEIMGDEILKDCDNVFVYFRGTIPPEMSQNTFDGSENITIHVPGVTLDTYKDVLKDNKENIITETVKVKFYSNNLLIDTIEIQYGSNIFATSFPQIPEKLGYIGEWEIEELINVTENTEVLVLWKPKDNIAYKVIHKVQHLDGSYEVKTEEVRYGTTDELITPKAKEIEGYEVVDVPSGIIKGDGSLVLEIKYQIKSYKIIFNTNGGNELNSILCEYNSEIPNTLPTPERIGYTFNSWEGILPSHMPGNDIILTAKWTPNTNTLYTVKYHLETLENEYILKDKNNYFGTTDEYAQIIEKEYNGFTISDYETKKINPDGSTVIDIYYNRNTYSITYLIDDEIYATKKVKFEANIPRISDPTKEGCTFIKWVNLPNVMPSSDISIEADFEKNVYKLEYKVNDEVYKTSSVVYGNALPTVTNPISVGYDFDDWYLDSNGQVLNNLTNMPSRDVTLYAHFTPRSDTKYTVIYRLEQEDGNFVTDQTIVKTGVTNTIATYEVLDYSSQGYTSPKSNLIQEKIKPDGSTEITVDYTKYSIMITFLVNNNQYDYITGKCNEKIDISKIPSNPVVEGYTFTGWDQEIPTTFPIENLEIHAVLEKNTCNLTYIIDDKIYKTVEYKYQDTITDLIEGPVVEGYQFDGWYMDSDYTSSQIVTTMPSDGLKLYGRQKAVNTNYQVQYMIEDLDGNYVQYGDTITLSGLTDTNTNVSPKEIIGFSAPTEIDNELIKSDGSTVVKLYYTRNIYILNFVDDTKTTPKNFYYEQTIVEPYVPTKTGYKAGVWANLPEVMPSQNLTVYAVYSTKETYTVTYYAYENSSEQWVYNIAYGNSVPVPSTNPTSTIFGKKFVGWDKTIPSTMPAYNLTITGVWDYKTNYTFNPRTTTEYTITDDGRFNNSYDTINLTTIFDIAGLKASGYTTFNVSINMEYKEHEYFKGNQFVFLYNGTSSTSYMFSEKEVYPGKSYAYTTVEFTGMSIEQLNDYLVVRYGASGDGIDDWYNRNIKVTITFVK